MTMKLHNTTLTRKPKKQKQIANWPFPPATGAVPWTRKQIKEYELQKLNQVEDAPI